MGVQLPEFKKRLRGLLKDNVQGCMQELENALDEERDLNDQFIMLASAYNDLKSKQNLNLLSKGEFDLGRAKAVSGLLAVVKAMGPLDLKKGFDEPEGVQETLLVVSANKAASEAMKQFFSSYFFRKVVYDYSGKVHKTGGADIVLFDNLIMENPCSKKDDEDKLTDAQKKHLDLLRSYMTDTHYKVIYYGQQLHLINEYRDRINAANSRFSLYARIRETLEFMKMYKEKPLAE